MHPYRLATVEHRGRAFPVVEIEDALIDFGLGYEAFKTATGKQDFFKARHGYTMLDILEEWPLFVTVLDDFAAHFRKELAGDWPEIAYRADDVTFLPPILYPNKILNARFELL